MTSSFPPNECLFFGSRPIGPAPPSHDAIEQKFWSETPSYPEPTEPPSAPERPARIVSPERARLAKALFMTMFGGMAALLVYSLVLRLAQG